MNVLSNLQSDNQVFLGMGAGTLNDVDTSEYESATSTWGKLFYEYGTLGTIIYLLFFGYCIFSSRKDKFIIATLMIIFWILGEHLFPPIVHNLLFALLIWPTDKFEFKAENSETGNSIESNLEKS